MPEAGQVASVEDGTMSGWQPSGLYRRSYKEACEILLQRARLGRSPMRDVPADVAEQLLGRLGTLAHDEWADTFIAAAEPHLALASERERAHDAQGARQHYRAAYGLLRLARYPAVTSPRKAVAYRMSQEAYLKAVAGTEPAVERVEIPLTEKGGPDRVIVAYLHRPSSPDSVPVLVSWGGVDSFKEERQTLPYVAKGFAVLAIDMPGTGDAPVDGAGQTDAFWDGIFDWIASRRDLDTGRVALFGVSTGGYWAIKVARTHAERVRGSISQGGPAHLSFQPDWIARSSRGEYPFELLETLAHAFGLGTAEEWVTYAPSLSLLDRGILGLKSAPLLLIAGVRDSVFPVDDAYLVIDQTAASTALLHPDGHQGHPPWMTGMVLAWLEERLQ